MAVAPTILVILGPLLHEGTLYEEARARKRVIKACERRGDSMTVGKGGKVAGPAGVQLCRLDRELSSQPNQERAPRTGDEAGRFTRRLLREMDLLWVFLARTVWSPQIIGLNGPYGLASSGANGPEGQHAPRVITELSGSSLSEKRVV